jgi:multiple sugar transport system permease protein
VKMSRIANSWPSFLGVIFRHVAMIAGAILFALPFFWMVSGSLKTLDEVCKYPIIWIPAKMQWHNYADAWRAAPFTRYLLNSLFITTTIIAGQFFTVVLAAYAFARFQFFGKNFLFMSILAIMMVSLEVRVIPIYMILSAFKWIDTYYALIVPMLTSPFGIFLVRQAFMKVPQDLADAAAIDGCNHLGILRQVMVPLSKPAIVTFMVFNFIHHYNNYFWPLIVTNSDQIRPITVGLARFRVPEDTGIMWHYLMAATTIALIPSLVVFIIGQKYFIRGIATEGLKG